MCGIVGYVGSRKSRECVLEGLSRLEYRGYDSAGFACLDTQTKRLSYAKATGQLVHLYDQLKKNPIDGMVSIGHTRWATHGKVTEYNAHPHFDCEKKIAVVHNGIVENHAQLRALLEKRGHPFSSTADTEVIAHLFEEAMEVYGATAQAMKNVVQKLDGAYTFVILCEQKNDTLFIARKRAPLCIGIGENELFVASDPLAFAGVVERVVFLPDETYALVTKNGFQLYDFNGQIMHVASEKIDMRWVDVEKGGHEHFMLKEIYEQKHAITRSVAFYQSIQTTLSEYIGLSREQLKAMQSITLVGCGTSWHAGKIAEFFFETIAGIRATAYLASEFRYRTFFEKDTDVLLTISQSGETADTLEALRMVKKTNIPTVALTNVASSTMVREADGFLLTQAGTEIAVASTKAFSTQVAALYWFAHKIAFEKGLITAAALMQAECDLYMAAELLEDLMEKYKHEIMSKDVEQYASFSRFIFLGRHVSYPFACEAALKMSEISYKMSLAYPAGELKHGPLALIDSSIPVFVFSHADPLLYQKLLGNVQEVKARNGHIIAFACEDQKELIELADRVFIVPQTKPLLMPLVMTGLMQFFCYAVAKKCGLAIDKPRNLAKSVTVE